MPGNGFRHWSPSTETGKDAGQERYRWSEGSSHAQPHSLFSLFNAYIISIKNKACSAHYANPSSSSGASPMLDNPTYKKMRD
jgi:hypothetical protein